jgi:hypothetical protein
MNDSQSGIRNTTPAAEDDKSFITESEFLM